MQVTCPVHCNRMRSRVLIGRYVAVRLFIAYILPLMKASVDLLLCFTSEIFYDLNSSLIQLVRLKTVLNYILTLCRLQLFLYLCADHTFRS